MAYHEACKLGRHGGVLDDPRAVLRALGVDYRETTPTGELNWCCGGGAGAGNREWPTRIKSLVELVGAQLP